MVSNSRNKFHQTWSAPFSASLYTGLYNYLRSCNFGYSYSTCECGYVLVRKRAVFSISIPTAFVILDQSIMAAEEQHCLDGLTTCTCECACQGYRACSLKMEGHLAMEEDELSKNPVARMHFQYFKNNEYLTRGQFCCKRLSFLSRWRRRMRRKNNLSVPYV